MTQTMTQPIKDPLAEIRRLYFETKPSTILRDFDRAIDLLKTLPTEAERERATVYMEGLAEMRKDWFKDQKPKGPGRPARGRRPATTDPKPAGGRKKP